jgi:heme exporter protein B
VNAALALFARDVRLAWRAAGDSATVVLFFVLAVAMVPFGVGPALETLARIAAGIIWVMALLAALLSFERLFQLDAEDGSLDLIVLAPASLELLVLAKCLAHWLTTGLPLAVAAPLLGVLLNLPVEAHPTLVLSLLLGTPSLSLVGAIGAALTVGARRGGVLLPLLVLPLYVPVLILGVAAVDGAIAGLETRPHILLLTAYLAAALAAAPFAAASALRQALD